MSQPRALLFDLFDTLIDLHFSRLPMTEFEGRRMPSTVVFQHEALLARGHEIELERFLGALRDTDREFRASHFEAGLEVPTERRFARLVERLDLKDDELPAVLTLTHMGQIRGVAETPAHHGEVLQRLAGEYRLGLCSNFSHAATARALLEEASLGAHFTSLSISETVGIRKPRPEIFEHALESLGVAPDEVVHVGDNLDADVRGAAGVGLRTIWATRRVADSERLLREHDGPRPTWVVDDLAAIGGLF